MALSTKLRMRRYGDMRDARRPELVICSRDELAVRESAKGWLLAGVEAALLQFFRAKRLAKRGVNARVLRGKKPAIGDSRRQKVRGVRVGDLRWSQDFLDFGREQS